MPKKNSQTTETEAAGSPALAFQIGYGEQCWWCPDHWNGGVRFSREIATPGELIEWISFIKDDSRYHLSASHPDATDPRFTEVIHNAWLLLSFIAKREGWGDLPLRPEPDRCIGSELGWKHEYSARVVNVKLNELVEYLRNRGAQVTTRNHDAASFLGDTNPAGDEVKDARKLARRGHTAGQQYHNALEKLPTALDREAFAWLVENESGFDITFKTWTRNLRLWREFYGQQKNKPRGGRTGRNVTDRSGKADERT